MTDPMTTYGDADLLQQQLGLTPSVGHQVSAIITFCGAIEYYLERALWRLRGIEPRGLRPDTDGKMISDLIAMLEQVAVGIGAGDARTLLELWCVAARSGFIVRHNIAHGLPMKLGETLSYSRNPRWHGEIRKREFGDFWADEHSLNLTRQALAVLLRVIFQLSRDKVSFDEVASNASLKALVLARSVLGEYASQDYSPSFEKY